MISGQNTLLGSEMRKEYTVRRCYKKESTVGKYYQKRMHNWIVILEKNPQLSEMNVLLESVLIKNARLENIESIL